MGLSEAARAGWIFALLAAAVVLPMPVAGWFDGLPWDRGPEMLAAGYFLPLVAAFRFRAFASRAVGWIALGVVVGKLLLGLAAPREGWGIRIFADEDLAAQGEWERGWETLWAPGFSSVQRRDWRRADEFPVEWANRYDQPLRRPSGLWLGEEKRREARPRVEVSGWVWLDAGESLDLGLGPDLRMRRGSWAGEDVPEIPAGTPAFPRVDRSGWYAMRAELELLSLFSGQAALAPSSVSGTQEKIPIMGRQRSSPDQPSCGPETRPGAWVGHLAKLTGWLMLTAGVFLGFSLVRSLPSGQAVLFLGWSLLAAAGPWLGRLAGLEITGALVYGLIPALLAGLLAPGLLAAVGPGRLILWILGVGMVPAWMALEGSRMTSVTLFPVGDDWLAQQNLARAVFVGGDGLSFLSEKIYVYQPGYRYLTGLTHLLFGSPAWASQLLDLAAVVAIASLVPLGCLWAGARPGMAVGLGFVTYAAYCSRPPFQLMGQCIHEYVATAALMAVACLLMAWSTLPVGRIPLLLVAVAVAYLVRQNHAPAILACVAFLAPRTCGGWGEILRAFRQKLARQGRVVFLVLAAVAGLVLLVCVRNWVSAGVFHINAPGNLAALTGESPSTLATTLGLVLRAKDEGWSHMGWLVGAGTAAAILTLGFRVGFFRRVPVEPALVLLAALAPFAVIRLLPCTTRFSFVLVPLAAVCLGALAAGLRPKESGAS